MNFKNWAVRFVEYLKRRKWTGKVVLIHDGYRARLPLDILEIILEGNVVVYALPAHTSGKTQPFNVVQFAAFKAALNRIVSYTTQTATGKAWNLLDVCALLRQANIQSFNPTNITSSFRRCGVWPCGAMKLLSVPRPSHDTQNQKLCSVQQLVQLLEERPSVIWHGILSKTATIS